MNTPMHRFKYTKLTKEQIAAKLVRTAAGPRCGSEFSDIPAGKSLKIVEYEGGSRGLDLAVVGAIARPIGCYDVKHFFGPKEK